MTRAVVALNTSTSSSSLHLLTVRLRVETIARMEVPASRGSRGAGAAAAVVGASSTAPPEPASAGVESLARLGGGRDVTSSRSLPPCLSLLPPAAAVLLRFLFHSPRVRSKAATVSSLVRSCSPPPARRLRQG